jgi:carbon storage regulator
MLILTRRTGEAIVIGQPRQVRLKVLSVVGNVVRIGFEADRDLTIHRAEVYRRINKKPKPE